MTTEDDFQAALDANPEDHQTRLVFADWLQERGDVRAEGYRALGVLRLWPLEYQDDGPAWSFHNGFGRYQSEDVPKHHALPKPWFEAAKMHNKVRLWMHPPDTNLRTRHEAEDVAALAFSKLPPESRAELLADGE